MTLKTFACDSIAEKNDFVNHFFQAKKQRHEVDADSVLNKTIKVGVYLACQPYVGIYLEFPFSFLQW